MFWLACCFSKIKKPNHFLENQLGIAGVCILTQLLPPWELLYLSFIDYHNNELAGQTILIHGTIVPYWKDGAPQKLITRWAQRLRLGNHFGTCRLVVSVILSRQEMCTIASLLLKALPLRRKNTSELEKLRTFWTLFWQKCGTWVLLSTVFVQE